MKILSLLLLAACTCGAARGFSQSLSLSVKNAPLVNVFKEIERQTAYRFVYTKEQLKDCHPVTVEVKSIPLVELLKLCFYDQPLQYRIEENYILVQTAPNKKIVPLSLFSVSGKVINEKSEAMPGISLQVKGSQTSAVTDRNGAFLFTAIAPQATIVVTGAEIETLEVAVQQRSYITIQVQAKVAELDQVIMTAYGQTTKRLNTGNIIKISSADIERQPVSNPLAAMQGRVPGMLISQSSGIAGSTFNVQIRGRSSLDLSLSGNEPLFIIDGIPFEPGNRPSNQTTNASNKPNDASQGGLSPLNSISPGDIASIEVLKDADATAIYGSRGANGVVLITTHKGKTGKLRLTAELNRGVSRVSRFLPMMNTAQYIALRKEAFANDGVIPTRSNAPDLLLWDTTRYTDFTQLFTGDNAGWTNARLSASGGSASTQFLISGSYTKQTNIFSDQLSDQITSTRFSINHLSDNKKINLVLSAAFTNDKNKLLRDDLTRYKNLPPNLALFDSAGNLKWSEGGVNYTTAFGNNVGNPLALLRKENVSTNQNLISNLQLSYKVSTKFVLRLNAGYNLFLTDEISLNPRTSLPPTSTSLPSSIFANSHSSSWIIEPQAEYRHDFLKGQLSLLAGGTWQDRKKESEYIDATGYTSDLLLRSIDAAGTLTASNSYEAYRYTAAFGKISYNWQDKYILNISGRRDGSSRFGPGKRFATFSAVGAGWIISQTSLFKKHLPFISFAKVRGSYGSTGNDQIVNYKYLDLWNSTSSTYQAIPGLTPSSLFNPDYNWELNRKFEMATELGFMKDRIWFSASYYLNRSSNQLINYKLPSQSGFTSIVQNLPALVQNSGLEFILLLKPLSRAHFSYTSSINLTLPKNKLVSFPGLATSTYVNSFVVGQSLGTYRKYRYLGLNDTTGIYMVEDVNKDGAITGQDLQFLGNNDTKWYGGWQHDIRYHQFDLSLFFEFKKQTGENYIGRISSSEYPGRMLNQPVLALDRWRKKGDVTAVQQYTQSVSSPAAFASTYLIASDGIYTDASYLRLKNLSLSYSLPAPLAKKWKLQSARLYLQAQNLFVITGYKGSDPETQDFYVLPPLKTITAGIKLTL